MTGFFEELKEQRWDDHRFYHHSRINQTLHLISALSFCVTYVMLFTHPVAAALFGWTFAMCIRQVGHFFFEPKGYDEINAATHDHKEAIKVGYNLRRKAILLVVWAAAPLALALDPTLLGVFPAPVDFTGYVRHVAWCWIAIGAGALVFRTVQLFFLQNVATGLVWLLKILTDPFHDVMLYWRAPLHLMRGELMDPDRPRGRA